MYYFIFLLNGYLLVIIQRLMQYIFTLIGSLKKKVNFQINFMRVKKFMGICVSSSRVTSAPRIIQVPVKHVTFRTVTVLHLRSPRIPIIACQTSRVGEVGRQVTGKRGRKGFAAPRGGLHANAGRGKWEKEKEDLSYRVRRDGESERRR
jgi:hypothetical protein